MLRIVALGLRLEHAERLPIDEEQVVGAAVAWSEDELADGDPAPGDEVDRVGVLNEPTGAAEHGVDLHPRAGLAREIVLGRWRRVAAGHHRDSMHRRAAAPAEKGSQGRPAICR